MATPTLMWAQRESTVYITWDYVNAKDVKVDLGEKSISFRAKVGDKEFVMDSVPLSNAIVTKDSKWFANDRCVQAILSKADKEWWDSLLADKGYKKFVKADWSRWVEEDDDAYTGHFPGMDFSAAGDWDDEPDSDDDVPLDDLDIGESSLPAEED